MNQRLLIPRQWTPANRLGGDAPALWLQPSTSNVTTGGSRQFTAANSEALAHGSVDMGTAGDLTISAWVYPDNLAGHNAVRGAGIARSMTGESIGDWMLGLDNDGAVHFSWWENSGDDADGEHITADGVIVAGQWSQILVIVSGGTPTLYVNGSQVAFGSTAATGTSWKTDSAIGRNYDTGVSYHWNGRIERCGVWHKAITAAERTYLWNSGQGRSAGDLGQAGTDGADLADADCVDYWPLNEASGDATGGVNSIVLTDTNTVTAAAGITTRARQYTAATSEYHTVASHAHLNINTGDVLLSVWFYRDTAAQQTILSKYEDASNFYRLELDAANKLHFDCDVGGVTKLDVQGATAVSTTGVWYHVAVVVDRDSAGNCKIYLDGADDTDGTPTTSTDDCDNTGALEVGRFGAGGNLWNGRLGRVALAKPSDASAVGAAFVAALYGDGDGIDHTALTADQITNWGVLSMWDGDEVSGNLIDKVDSHDMTDTNTVTVNPGPGTELGVVVDEDQVQQWLSKEGNAYAFVQETAAKKPTFNAADSNFANRPTLTFEGSDDLLRYAGELTTATAGTAFVVAIRGAAGALHTYLSSSDEAGDAEYLKLGAAAANDHLYTQDSTDADDILSSGTAVGASAFIHTWISSGAGISLRNNGAVDALTVDGGANNGDWFGDCTGRDNFCIGALKRNAGEADQYNGQLAEIVVYDRELTLSEIRVVERYLAARYHIALAP